MKTPIKFFSQGASLAGTLWFREAVEKRPAIVVTGSWMTVEEQMPSNYAPLLANAGFIALTFDFKGFGKSEGAPRELESAHSKAEDIINAVSFLRTNPQVDPDRIGVVSICASSGYTAKAMVGEPRIRSAVMIAPWLHDAEIVKAVYGGDEGVSKRIAQAIAAREAYASTGKVEYVKAASNSDSTAAMYWPGDALDYYLNPQRGAVKEWGGRFALQAWKEWLEFDPIAYAPHISSPIRIVTSEQSATPGGAKKFEKALRVPHDIIWVAGTQFDFYDNPETVALAAKHAIEHLERTL